MTFKALRKSSGSSARKVSALNAQDRANIMRLQKMWVEALDLNQCKEHVNEAAGQNDSDDEDVDNENKSEKANKSNEEDNKIDKSNRSQEQSQEENKERGEQKISSLELVFSKLFELEPEAKIILSDISKRLRALEGIYSSFLAYQLDDSINHTLVKLGKSHKDWGITKNFYIKFIVCLVYMLSVRLGERFTPEIRNAFVKWYCSLASIMVKSNSEKKEKGNHHVDINEVLILERIKQYLPDLYRQHMECIEEKSEIISPKVTLTRTNSNPLQSQPEQPASTKSLDPSKLNKGDLLSLNGDNDSGNNESNKINIREDNNEKNKTALDIEESYSISNSHSFSIKRVGSPLVEKGQWTARTKSFNEHASSSAPDLGMVGNVASLNQKVSYIRGHQLKPHLFKNPTFCAQCDDFLWTVYKEGLICSECGTGFHESCSKNEEIEPCCGNTDSNLTSSAKDKSHSFKLTSYRKPTFCYHCRGLLVGLIRQGYQCTDCKINVHKACQKKVTTCDPSRIDKETKEQMKEESKTMERKKKELEECTKTNCAIDNFELCHILGGGAFYKTCVATHKNIINKTFCVRFIGKTFFDTVNRSPVIERDILLLLSSSDFFNTLLWCFQDLHYVYYVFDSVNGMTLDNFLKMKGTQNEKVCRFFSAEIICGLQFVHSQNIIHCDLNLENILIDPDGHVKITGLQYSQTASSNSNTSSRSLHLNEPRLAFCGSLEFLAPELLFEQPEITPAIDWWALGAILYYLLVGSFPFSGSTDFDLFESIVEADLDFPDHLSDECVAFLCRLLTRFPDDRLGSNGIEKVKNHFFFSTISWDTVSLRKGDPPFRPEPKTKGDNDVTDDFQVFPEFTIDCPTQKCNAIEIYKDFSYESPLVRTFKTKS